MIASGERNAAILFKEVMDNLFRPVRPLKVSDFADRYRFLSPESSLQSGRWKTSLVPYMEEVMDAVCEPNCKQLVVMIASQLGKSELLNNIILHSIHRQKAVVFMHPTDNIARSYSKMRLDPMFRDCPVVSATKSKKDGNTLKEKVFTGPTSGASLYLCSSNAASTLAGRSASVGVIDELDRCAGEARGAVKEGSPYELLRQRTITAWDGFMVVCSTPTIARESPIEALYNQSDMRIFEVPCPRCETFQSLDWSRFHWEGKESDTAIQKPETVTFECKACHHKIPQSSKTEMVSKGRWRSQNPDARSKGIVGFHANAFISPFVSWTTLIQKYLDSKDDVLRLKVWWNTTLGLPFEQTALTSPAWEAIYERRETYRADPIPERVALLTLGCDVQGDRIEASLVGWNGREAWVLEHRTFPGCPPLVDDVSWKDLERYIYSEFKHANCGTIKVKRVAVDSGFATSIVYQKCREMSLKGTQVLPVKGDGHLMVPIAQPRKVETGLKKPVLKWGVGVGILKEEFYARLHQKSPEFGQEFPNDFIHFPDLPEDYFKQICGETLVLESRGAGSFKRVWKQSYMAVEALDCFIYALAMWYSLNAARYRDEDWKALLDATYSKTDKRHRRTKSM